MAGAKADKKGVFCLETDQWYRQKDRASVEPALELINRLHEVPYEHRDVATESEFEFFLDKYFKLGYKTHSILYLGFHGGLIEGGTEPCVTIGDKTDVPLEQLEQWIDGRCKDRLIYFGSCSVLATHGNRLARFVRNTKALAIAGYKKDVDWIESAAFDILAISKLQGASFKNKKSIATFDRNLKESARGLYDRLGFKLVIRGT